ncbi:MAG TPA: type II secretion system protein [Tepidisphaeraceae bacterium]|jgi:prepilin-type N-terminal cleavage/methylation domain-containing protein|nr:type II secretion system protein [Tepidisphaeraceae bacterium]
MGIQSLRWWQWSVIGAVAGAALAGGRLLAVSDRRLGGDGFISQAVFERSLRQPASDGKAMLSGIVIRPHGSVDLVSATRYDPDRQAYENVVFAAPRPFVPLGGRKPPRPDYSISDYLSEIAASDPALTFRSAWWEMPWLMLTLYAIAGALLVGGVWPVLLRLLVGAGFGRPDEAYDLTRFKSETRPQRQDEPDEEARRRLAELEAEMAAGLEGGAKPVASDATVSRAPVPQLLSGPQEAQPEPVTNSKDFAGQYYPVEKKAPHGFTFIELLVVIGIVAVLTAILLPATRTARLEAQTVRCASNLKRIGEALHMYESANHGWLPAWSGWHTWPPGTEDDSAGPAWTIELIPYIGTPDSPVYNCPSFPGPVRCRNYFLGAQWAGRGHRNAMKFTDVTMTGRFVLSGDKTQRALYPPPFGVSEHPLDDADPDDYGQLGLTPVLAWPWDEGGFYMHRRGNNVLFDDMHVALFSNYDDRAMTWNPHLMQSRSEVTPD